MATIRLSEVYRTSAGILSRDDITYLYAYLIDEIERTMSDPNSSEQDLMAVYSEFGFYVEKVAKKLPVGSRQRDAIEDLLRVLQKSEEGHFPQYLKKDIGVAIDRIEKEIPYNIA